MSCRTAPWSTWCGGSDGSDGASGAALLGLEGDDAPEIAEQEHRDDALGDRVEPLADGLVLVAQGVAEAGERTGPNQRADGRVDQERHRRHEIGRASCRERVCQDV